MTTWQVEQASEPSQAPSRSMSFRCAISSTERPSGASTSTRVPSVLMNVIFGIPPRLLVLLVLEPGLCRGGAHCHIGLHLVKAPAAERLADGAVDPPLGEGKRGLFQGLDGGCDQLAILARLQRFQALGRRRDRRLL